MVTTKQNDVVSNCFGWAVFLIIIWFNTSNDKLLCTLNNHLFIAWNLLIQSYLNSVLLNSFISMFTMVWLEKVLLNQKVDDNDLHKYL